MKHMSTIETPSHQQSSEIIDWSEFRHSDSRARRSPGDETASPIRGYDKDTLEFMAMVKALKERIRFRKI